MYVHKRVYVCVLCLCPAIGKTHHTNLLPNRLTVGICHIVIFKKALFNETKI